MAITDRPYQNTLDNAIVGRIINQSGGEFSCGYSCRDLEGHLWNFGSYDPWSE
jgi:hypothetical protein